MRMNRVFWFFVSIIIGLFIGLVYGWFIRPVNKAEAELSSLRADHKADYVLMVAEIYSTEKDLTLAISKLDKLGDDKPIEIVKQAIKTATELGYSSLDLEIMNNLLNHMSGASMTGGVQ